jgi:hypothetical protein
MMSNVAAQPSISRLADGLSCMSTYAAVMLNVNRINASLGSNALAVGVFSEFDELKGMMGLIGDQQLTAFDIMTHGGLLRGDVNRPYLLIPGSTYTISSQVPGGYQVLTYSGYAREATINDLRLQLMPNAPALIFTHCGPGPTAWTKGVSQMQSALGAGQLGNLQNEIYINRP